MAVMLAVSKYSPRKNLVEYNATPILEMTPWRFAKPLSFVLCTVTVLIYVWLGLIL